MTQYQPGEVMALTWDSWMPSALYVRGHMDVHDANVALAEYYGDDDHQWATPVAMYGRWSMGHGPEGGQGLMEYWDPGAGRFPIMVAKVKYTPIDSYAWDERKGTSWSRLGKSFDCDCDCDHHWSTRCACRGKCSCHWHPLREAREDGRVDCWVND